MVLRGRILDVAVDLRRSSPTYGRYVTIEISADTGQQVYIPVGFAHGFLTLNRRCRDVQGLRLLRATLDSGIRWDDPDIAIPWPMRRLTSSFPIRTAASASWRNLIVLLPMMVIRSYPCDAELG